jgi:cytochrome c oxidase assembly factor CtaG
MGGLMLLIQIVIAPSETSRFFLPSSHSNIGFTGPLALGSAVLLLLSTSIAFYIHGIVRFRFSSDPSPLKRVLCLLSFALTLALLLAGMFIIILGPAALSIMDLGLWQSR